MPPTHRPPRDSRTPDAAPDVPAGPHPRAMASRPVPWGGLHVPAGASLPPGTSYATLHAAFQAQPRPADRKLAADRARARMTVGREEVGSEATGREATGQSGGQDDDDPAVIHRSVAAWRLRNARRFSVRVLSAATVAVTAVALSAPTASAAPSPTWPKGVDIASWQHPGSAPIDWNAVKGSGVAFTIVKATEGTEYTNPYFAADRDAAGLAGLTVGAYHYARPAAPISTAVDQARHFLAVTGLTRSAGHLAPVLDLETTGGLDPVALAAWTRAFLEEIETQTGRAPIIYTYRSFWTDHMADTDDFALYPFWFAIYNNEDTPGWLPGGWSNWAIWQYSSSGDVPGIIGNVDMNAACCSPASLAALADGTQSELDRRYASGGLMRIALGAPTNTELAAGGGGRWRPFTNGLLFWSVRTGARALHGEVARKYLALGGSDSFLKRPLSDVEWAAAPGAHQAMFEGGWIYWSLATGAHEVHGQILRHYLDLGGSVSSLGLPVTDEYSVPGGRESAFQFGRLRWMAATNSVVLLPATPGVGGAASTAGAAAGAALAPQ
ncbi:GH25 family lysozyme [Parafrankia sp. EUN1f]|uniref:GH25 family lysozyme n=1 Tax=Parafrankia sp. EUN1f TaxID=102897 RepID=UPI000A0396B0|nr:GH25 family lysozyme [Parafrankia sp. EUN1f]